MYGLGMPGLGVTCPGLVGAAVAWMGQYTDWQQASLGSWVIVQ